MVAHGIAVSARLAGLALLAAAAGCATPEAHYRWGVYEDLVYEMYARPGEADPGTQAAVLSEDVARTLAEGKRVPPGVHAHLGYVYYQQGLAEAARQEFLTEKQLFPESAVLIDGILERMGPP